MPGRPQLHPTGKVEKPIWSTWEGQGQTLVRDDQNQEPGWGCWNILTEGRIKAGAYKPIFTDWRRTVFTAGLPNIKGMLHRSRGKLSSRISGATGGSRALTEGPFPLRGTPFIWASLGWGGENESPSSVTSLSIKAPSKIAPLLALIRSQKMSDWGRGAVWRAENQFMPSFPGLNLSLVIFDFSFFH